MVCPNCGADAYRSRSRNFRESFIKRFTPLKHFRCHDCGWRGLAAPGKISLSGIDQKAVYIWIAGMLLAIAIGMLGARIIR